MTGAIVDRTPLGYRRNDPDETLGRQLYRQRADAEARMQVALRRGVRLAKEPTHDL